MSSSDSLTIKSVFTKAQEKQEKVVLLIVDADDYKKNPKLQNIYQRIDTFHKKQHSKITETEESAETPNKGFQNLLVFAHDPENQECISNIQKFLPPTGKILLPLLVFLHCNDIHCEKPISWNAGRLESLIVLNLLEKL